MPRKYRSFLVRPLAQEQGSAQILPAHGVVIGEAMGRPGRYHPPIHQEERVVANPQCVGETVISEDDRPTSVRVGPKEGRQEAHVNGVARRERFVADEDRGVGNEDSEQLEATPFAPGEIARSNVETPCKLHDSTRARTGPGRALVRRARRSEGYRPP